MKETAQDKVYKSNSQMFVFGSKIVEENEMPDPNMNENETKYPDVLPNSDNRINVDGGDTN